jgi:hypothetical protein
MTWGLGRLKCIRTGQLISKAASVYKREIYPGGELCLKVREDEALGGRVRHFRMKVQQGCDRAKRIVPAADRTLPEIANFSVFTPCLLNGGLTDP